MKKLMSMVIGLAMLAPGTCLAQSLTAAQILAKVAETYSNLHSFRSEAAGRTHVQRVSAPATAAGWKWYGGPATEVAESRPGKVRLSNKNFLLVSDGETTWTYLPGPREYQEVKAAPLLRENWKSCPEYAPCSGLDYVWIFSDAVPPGRRARLRGEQAVTVGGRQVDCYVITVPVSYRVGGRKAEGASETLWVDKSRFIVWHALVGLGWVAETPEEARLNNSAADNFMGANEYAVERLDPGPVPEETFKFHPPAGAKPVESMTVGSRWDPWLTNGMLDLPEASVDEAVLGQKGPDFALQDLDGKTFRLSGLRGKTVVLDFWASWCKRCEGELAAVQKLHDELASKGVVFFGIDDESLETVKSFVKAHGYTFPMLVDSEQEVHQLYDVRWAPTTVVINRKGKIAAQYIGAGGEAQLLSALKKAGLKLPAASVRK